jgi:hypothetical protein
MQLENLFKSWFTTLMGAGIIVMVAYEYFWDGSLSDMQALFGSLGGFALMWMRDAISSKANDFISAIIDKFKSK